MKATSISRSSVFKVYSDAGISLMLASADLTLPKVIGSINNPFVAERSGGING